MKKEIVLITGANGTVAKMLTKLLEKEYSLRFLTRKKQKNNEYEWNDKAGGIKMEALKDVQHIIHLAGAGIADKKWTKERKKVIYSSRVDTAKLILKHLEKYNIKIKSFISASAVGYYGTVTTEHIFTENDSKGNDFLSKVCEDWEKVAHSFSEKGVAERTVILRFGVVLSKQGGALAKMISPIKNYFGACVGTGKQYMPWIHIEDLCGIVQYALHNAEIKGIYNTVAPEHITNKDFTKTATKILKKPLFLPNVPQFVLKLFLGEMAVVALEGSRISAQKILEAGYKFKFPDLQKALKDLLS